MIFFFTFISVSWDFSHLFHVMGGLHQEVLGVSSPDQTGS